MDNTIKEVWFGDNLASGASQAVGTVVVLPVICTGLPNSFSPSGLGIPGPCWPKRPASSKSEVELNGNLRIGSWNVGTMKGRSRKLTDTEDEEEGEYCLCTRNKMERIRDKRD